MLPLGWGKPMQFDRDLIIAVSISAVIILILMINILGLRRRLAGMQVQVLEKGESATKFETKVRDFEVRFALVLDAEKEAAAVVAKADLAKELAQKEVSDLAMKARAEQLQIDALKTSYLQKKTVFDALVAQLAVYDDRLAFSELGLYEPHFDFDASESYKAEIERVRAQQKAMVSAKNAVVCHTNWTVDGSASKGKTMTDRNIRLTLRAFNNECEAAISNVRWNNANAMEKRITNAQAQIDKANASNQVVITDTYLKLKLRELYLAHEYQEKLKEEREERAEMARAAREEQKLAREIEDAEREEAKFQRMLERAQAEAAGSVGAKQDALLAQVQTLSEQLTEAHAKLERAQAMAERTKTGYVYIISNIGSFGPDFVKIGLTRRLDPIDRVRELGDASVPFFFDVHAIIYSDDAPALERALHAEFATTRVNATNLRKEFFRASIDQVEAAVKRLAPSAPFFKDIEAQEYHETLALRKQALATAAVAAEAVFPDAI